MEFQLESVLQYMFHSTDKQSCAKEIERQRIEYFSHSIKNHDDMRNSIKDYMLTALQNSKHTISIYCEIHKN